MAEARGDGHIMDIDVHLSSFGSEHIKLDIMADHSNISDCQLSELSAVSRDQNGDLNEIEICKL